MKGCQSLSSIHVNVVIVVVVAEIRNVISQLLHEYYLNSRFKKNSLVVVIIVVVVAEKNFVIKNHLIRRENMIIDVAELTCC